MKKIVFALITTLLIVGCTPKIYRSMGMRPTISVSTYRSNLMPVFDSLAAPLYFTADVTFKENNLSGMLAMTEEGNRAYRIVMMTTFGMQIFDFSISRDSFIVHSCMEQLNKKVILNLLRDDFRSILMLDVPDQFKCLLYQTPANSQRWGCSLRTKNGEYNYLLYPNGTNYIRMVGRGSGLKGMIGVFDEDVVMIEHAKLGLKINLKQIKQE